MPSIHDLVGMTMGDPPEAHNQDQTRALNSASVTLRGWVGKIFPPDGLNGAGTAEILIDGAEHLYREIRIPNRLKDADGKDVVLQPGGEIEITIELRAGAK